MKTLLITFVLLIMCVINMNAQSVSVTLTTAQQSIMLQAHGVDYQKWLDDKLLEATINHLSEAAEVVKRRNIDAIEKMNTSERAIVNPIIETVKTREAARIKAEQDSLRILNPDTIRER